MLSSHFKDIYNLLVVFPFIHTLDVSTVYIIVSIFTIFISSLMMQFRTCNSQNSCQAVVIAL